MALRAARVVDIPASDCLRATGLVDTADREWTFVACESRDGLRRIARSHSILRWKSVRERQWRDLGMGKQRLEPAHCDRPERARLFRDGVRHGARRLCSVWRLRLS